MPKRLSIEEVQNRADKQGKTIRVLTFSLTSEPATATCLNCGDLITCRGSTLLDKRSKTAGCENCGQKSQAKGRRRYSQNQSWKFWRIGTQATNSLELMRTPSSRTPQKFALNVQFTVILAKFPSVNSLTLRKDSTPAAELAVRKGGHLQKIGLR